MIKISKHYLFILLLIMFLVLVMCGFIYIIANIPSTYLKGEITEINNKKGCRCNIYIKGSPGYYKCHEECIGNSLITL